MSSFDALLQNRQRLTNELIQNPYSIKVHLDRSKCYESLGYPDLAAGDAYKALLLLDELLDEDFEYHENVLEALEKEHAQLHLNDVDLEAELQKLKAHDSEIRFEAVEHKFNDYAPETYRLLARNLADCLCLKSAYDYCLQGLDKYHDDEDLEATKLRLLERYKSTIKADDKSWNELCFDWKDLSDSGAVRREPYPWNECEPERHSEASVVYLNTEMAKIAPKCVVSVVELPVLTGKDGDGTSKPNVKQLGIFAREYIAPGELVLSETSILTANNRLHDLLCDACSCELPPLSEKLYNCGECEDTIFCSAKCKELAMSRYHPAVCGKELDAIGKDPDAKDAATALYFLLLGRTFAFAETQGLHPLNLHEVKYLWGDFIQQPESNTDGTDSSSKVKETSLGNLPFSFQFNILSPLHLLEKMDINIFTQVEKYDVWIFNVLYAKFGGVASGRMNHRTGKPEVCAVHPMWCLANHSCAPNVRWEWGGEINFWARNEEQMVKWGDIGREDGSQHSERAGLRKGEEIFNHYCDIELDAHARREWAVGALGGLCECKRCQWETGNPKG